MPKLTKRFVEAIVPHATQRLIIWDTELKGFGVIVRPSGRLTYCVQYRNMERIQKRLKLGVHGQVTTEEARILAKQHLSSVVHGEDPLEEKQMRKALPTIQHLAELYMERHATVYKATSSITEDQRLLTKYILPAMGDLKVAHVTYHTIEELHLKMKRTPYYANRMLALLSTMFGQAVKRGWRPDNPVQKIQKYPEQKRERWLNEEELKRLWRVLEEATARTQTAFLFQLLILTGAREGELRVAEWKQFDLAKGVWTKPSHHTKQRKLGHSPLSEKAVQILKELQARNTTNSPYVFPGRVPGKPLQESKTSWRTIRKKAGVPELHIHDLRHTHASHLVSSGVSLSVVGKLLGHTQASTTHRYAHLADAPLKQATEFFGQKITELMEEKGS